MEFNEVFRAYLEVGLLGLCAILMIILFYKDHKRNSERQDEQTKYIEQTNQKLDDKFQMLLDDSRQQNKIMFDRILESDKEMMKSVVKDIVTHVPSKQENLELTKISEEVDSILQRMIIETKASRACIVQYHNGGKGVNRQSFLKMSMTNEQVTLGVKPLAPNFKDQFRSVIAYFVKEIQRTGHCYIESIDSIKDIDASMYEFMIDNNVKSKYGYGIHDKDGMCIGFVCIEFRSTETGDVNQIDKLFKEEIPVLETLLTLNVIDNN